MQRLVQERANSLVQATATLVTLHVEQFQNTLVELADALSRSAVSLFDPTVFGRRIPLGEGVIWRSMPRMVS